MNAREYQSAIAHHPEIQKSFNEMSGWRHALMGDCDLNMLMGIAILIVLYFAEKYQTFVSFEEANLAIKNSVHRTEKMMLSILLIHTGRLLGEEIFDLEEERHEYFQRILNSLFALIAKQNADPLKLLDNVWKELTW